MRKTYLYTIYVCIASLSLVFVTACKKDAGSSSVTYVKVDYPKEYVEAGLPTFEKATSAEVSPMKTSSSKPGDPEVGKFMKLFSDRPMSEVVAYYEKEKNKNGWSVVEERETIDESSGAKTYKLEMLSEEGETFRVLVSDMNERALGIQIAIYHFQ